MQQTAITPQALARFRAHLLREEHSPGTVENYLRGLRKYACWLAGRPAGKDTALGWKAALCAQGYQPVTVNAMLAALNAYFRYCGHEEWRVKALRVQRRLFRPAERELTRQEYEQLCQAARSQQRERLLLLMEAICATGVRVSEVKYLTVEAARAGRADISLKGKVRTILLPGKLCRKLLRYAKQKKIASGEIFLTRSGKSFSRRQIWAEMKRLCQAAGVQPAKVFPHNLRHLFARIFYQASRDVARLADLLGHSSIETTRIYLISTGAEHARQLDQLGLVS